MPQYSVNFSSDFDKALTGRFQAAGNDESGYYPQGSCQLCVSHP